MTDAQLATIERLREALSAAGVRFWLRGGWAIDFRLGRVTRAHEDVDAVAWQRHRRRLRNVLTAPGFRVARETERQIDLEGHGVGVTFAFLARDRGGRIVTHGIPEWGRRPDGLSLGWRRPGGAAWRVVSARQLLAEKKSDPRPTPPEGRREHRGPPRAAGPGQDRGPFMTCRPAHDEGCSGGMVS